MEIKCNMLLIVFTILMNAALISSKKSCKILSQNLSAADIDVIVNEHNRLRAKVANGQEPGQPSASNMKILSWDNELASKAQKWANKCKFQHIIVHLAKYFWVGQNLYMQSGGDKPDLAKAVQAWYNEVVKPGFKSRNINPFKFSFRAGHYTQVVWADTNKVGCGLTTFRKRSSNRTILVCNYGPGGNMIGSTMYKLGAPCSECNKGCSAQAGLCN